MESGKKSDLAGLLAVLFLLSLSVAVSVIVLEFGWGLQPKSWWWIIGGGVFAQSALRSLSDKLTK